MLAERISAAQRTFLIFVAIAIVFAGLHITGLAAGDLSFTMVWSAIIVVVGVIFIRTIWVLDPMYRWFERFRRRRTLEEIKDEYAKGKLTEAQFDRIWRAEQIDDEIARLKTRIRQKPLTGIPVGKRWACRIIRAKELETHQRFRFADWAKPYLRAEKRRGTREYSR